MRSSVDGDGSSVGCDPGLAVMGGGGSGALVTLQDHKKNILFFGVRVIVPFLSCRRTHLRSPFCKPREWLPWRRLGASFARRKRWIASVCWKSRKTSFRISMADGYGDASLRPDSIEPHPTLWGDFRER